MTDTLTPSAQLHREQLNDDLFRILEDHLYGMDRGILRARLESLCNDERQGGKSALKMYGEAHLSAENAAKLKTLLLVSEDIKEPNTLFDWIKVLSQKNYSHRHLEDFFHLVKEVKPQKNWTVPLFITTLATALGGISLNSMPEQMRALEAFIAKMIPAISAFLQSTFSVLKNIPLVLFVYTILRIPLQAYHSIYHDIFRSTDKRTQKWAAGTLPATLTLISYALCYQANGVFTPLAMTCFIASSLIGVTHSLINFRLLEHTTDTPLTTTTLEKKLDYIRQEERQLRTEKTIKVNFFASAAVSICVILWGFLPPSPVIMIGSILFINLVGTTKNTILTRIHTKGAESLQKQLLDTSRGDRITLSTLTQQDILKKALEKTFENTINKKLDEFLEKKIQQAIDERVSPTAITSQQGFFAPPATTDAANPRELTAIGRVESAPGFVPIPVTDDSTSPASPVSGGGLTF
ncbi:MAG: hypothetical protein K0U24_06550 [Gammaproteobacteria bacterium]|nr:hypothetical protein [Gammaproteobacteria bacterium]MCH9716203.1 hypothetical protein [Gammaproteobacteria bacterium]MCH9763864.1 hypothetical protein [Gammaproteobacteria bacterium]